MYYFNKSTGGPFARVQKSHHLKGQKEDDFRSSLPDDVTFNEPHKTCNYAHEIVTNFGFTQVVVQLLFGFGLGQTSPKMDFFY